MRWVRCFVSLGVVLGMVSTASAQDWFDLNVPTGALTFLHVDLQAGRSMAIERAIRAWHNVAFEPEVAPEGFSDLARGLADLQRLDVELARAPQGVSLKMAGSAGERDILRDILERVGVRLRERRNVYTVEPHTGNDESAMRRRLAQFGIDGDGLVTKLNRGETVVLAPETTTFPSPISLEAWSRLLEAPLTPRTLFGAIITNRRASLLYVGLLALSADTRRMLAARPELLRYLYQDASSAVAAFGGAFRVDTAGRVITPGGAAAVDLWENVFDERVTEPDKFARSLFNRDGGRLAYFYDTITHLDESHQRFALGLWIADRGRRLERFRALSRTFVDVDQTWTVTARPFTRPQYDPAGLLGLVAVEASGAPVGPTLRKLWAQGLDGIDLPDAGSRSMQNADEDGSIDAAWLAEQLILEQAAARHAQLDRLAFGQRVFSSARAEEVADVLVAIRAFGRFPSLALTLERMGLRSPALYARVARHALALEQIEDPKRAIPMLAQFQGSLALLDHLTRAGGVPAERVEALVRSLSEVRIANSTYEGRLADWIEQELLGALPPATGTGERPLETRLLKALAENATERTAFEWEGATYMTDIHAAAERNLAGVRAKQPGNSLDAVLAVHRTARALRTEPQTVEQLKTLAAALRTAGATLAAPRPWTGVTDDAPVVRRVVDRAVRDLSRITRPRDAGKASEIARPLAELVDYLLGETLVALAYAPVLGNAADLIGPSADISHRHNFGLVSKLGTSDATRRAAWLRPRQDSEIAVGQALTGSLLGLDLGFFRKRLRRLAVDAIPPASQLNPAYRDGFTQTLALTQASALNDAGLQALAGAVRRGRERIASAGRDYPTLTQLASEARMGDERRELLSWVAAQEAPEITRLFSVSELFWLGRDAGDAGSNLAPWGTSHEALSGCYCLRFPGPGAWAQLTGRAGSGQLAAGIADLNLRLAELLSELQVPAALYPSVLAMATQDFIDSAPAMFDDDWLAIAGEAQGLTKERVEDYVSAIVANGPVAPSPRSTP